MGMDRFATMVVLGMMTTARVYEYRLASKVNLNGMGNQFWDAHSGCAVYRVADAIRSYAGTQKTQIVGSFKGHWRDELGTSWSLLFDVSGVPEVAVWEDVAQLPVKTSGNCSEVKRRMVKQQMWWDWECEETTPEAACERSDFVWLDETTLPCPPILPTERRGSNHPFSSPYFVDPLKKRHCTDDCATADDTRLPLSPQSPIADKFLGDALRGIEFSSLVHDIAAAIVGLLGGGVQDMAAVHVRRGDRSRARAWRNHFNAKFKLFGANCTSCDTCRYHCLPTDDNVLGVWRNFSRTTRVCWIATDDTSLADVVAHEPTTARGVFVGRSSAFVNRIVQEHTAHVRARDKPRVEDALDLFFLARAGEAIFDLYSTFSAIAYRKREAEGRPIMFW